MKKSLVSLCCLIIVVTVAGIAIAAETAAPSPAPSALATVLRESVFPLIGSLLMGVLTIFLQRVGARFKIEALTQKDNFITQLAYQGITLAEEKAAQYVGSKAALTGSQKLDIAVSHILSIMPKVPPARAEAITHAVLAQIPGTGATGNNAFSLTPIFSAMTAELPPAETQSVPQGSPA